MHLKNMCILSDYNFPFLYGREVSYIPADVTEETNLYICVIIPI